MNISVHSREWPNGQFGGWVGQVGINYMVSTLALILILLTVRYVLNRMLQKNKRMRGVQKRKILANIRSLLFVVLLFGLLVIWAPQLRTWALSLTAFAVALVIAFKELILCVSGKFLENRAEGFSIGSWVKVGDVLGEVIDQRILSTSIQEISPHDYHYTGRTVVVPNSLFLSTAFYNLHFLRHYVFHNFNIYLEAGKSPVKSMAKLKKLTDKAMGAYMKEAEAFLVPIRKKADIEIKDIRPHVRLYSVDEKKLRIEVTIFAPRREVHTIEQNIIKGFYKPAVKKEGVKAGPDG